MSAEMDDLAAKVAANSAVVASAVILINGFSARLDAIAQLKDNEIKAAVTGLSAELNSASTALSEAVAANTPSEPPAARAK